MENIERYRKSSYVISVELDHTDDKYMLIHGYTGAMDVIDQKMYKYIFANKVFTEDSFPFPIDIFRRLIKRGYLTTKNQEEEYKLVGKIADIFHKRSKLFIKSFVLLVTYNCNFKCPYCYEKEVVKTGENDPEFVISKEMVDKAFNAMIEIEPNQNLRNKSISLFGGEPLLKENRSIIEYIINKGQEYGFVFAATSNGYDLNHYEDLLGEGLIQGVQITIDGTQGTHDQRRVHCRFGNSFEKILKNIKIALDRGVAIRVRINVDNSNLNELPQIDDLFRKMGLYSYEKFSVYAVHISGDLNFIPENSMCATDTKMDESYLSQKDFLQTFKNCNLKIEHDSSLFLNLYNSISKRRALTLSPCHCGAQSGSYAFDPFGFIYTCLEVVGDKTKAVGTYNRNLNWNEEKDKWYDRNIGKINKCSKCRHALLCGGGCFAKTFSSTTPIESYCDDFPIVLKTTVNEVYARYKERAELQYIN